MSIGENARIGTSSSLFYLSERCKFDDLAKATDTLVSMADFSARLGISSLASLACVLGSDLCQSVLEGKK